MIKKLLFIVVLISFFFAVHVSFSQIKLNVKVSASNLLRYGTGKINSATGDEEKKYFEELADVRLFVNDFLFGARYEFDDPIEYGKSTKSISRRFIEFKKDDFTVRAGNYYELFGKGLTLNAFENRPLGFNTQADGLKLYYKHTFGKNIKFNGTILGGDIDYTDILDTSRTEHYSIRAGNFSVSPKKFITIGGSYLYANGQIPIQNTYTEINSEIFEANLGLSYNGFDFYGSYANKVTISDPNAFYPQSKAPRGDGGYGFLSYTRGGLGITIDYKNYRFNLVTPNERSTSNPFKPLPFQNAPTAIKEYSSTLLSRFPHNIDFGDEVGFQIDIFYSPAKNLTINGNFSLTSRHYDYKDIDTTAKTRYERIERSNAWLPSLTDELSPYWEFYLEGEYYYNKVDKVKLGIARKTSILYSIVDPASSEKIRSFTVPLEAQYTFAKIYSIKLIAEFQSAYNNLRSEGENDYISQFTSIALARSPDLILVGNVEITTDNEDPSGKKRWANVELTYRFSTANTVTLSYGSERGGIKCSSGICRYVNPFNGFRLTVINNFN
ncbi:MAG TPA: DUF6029 family protein [Ignavibacteria bacterium]|nr:DUF6029 family protein [Ignavibacteria bacterium]